MFAVSSLGKDAHQGNHVQAWIRNPTFVFVVENLLCVTSIPLAKRSLDSNAQKERHITLPSLLPARPPAFLPARPLGRPACPPAFLPARLTGRPACPP